jgi:hypothetical protein
LGYSKTFNKGGNLYFAGFYRKKTDDILTDQRQTKCGSIYTGSLANPEFKGIYEPLGSVVINAGIRIKWLTLFNASYM